MHSADRATACAHCGLPNPPDGPVLGDAHFCCQGCKTVYELLHESGLEHFYRIQSAPGVKVEGGAGVERYAYLDDESVRRRLLDFSDGRTARATLHIPSMHCAACVWLLENLFRIEPAIGASQVNFPRKELSVRFDESAIPLSRVVALLASLGYEPSLRMHALEKGEVRPDRKPLLLRIGVAGFAFGNIMLLSIPTYFGMEAVADAAIRAFFGWVSVLLAAPVLFYSASVFWKAAWTGLRQGRLTLDFPIALGIAALFGQSFHEVASGAGPGYLDSFTGLIFLLLVGRLFQQKTYDALSFERDYRSYFPLSIRRLGTDGPEQVPISKLEVGDRIEVRGGELIPADAVLRQGTALIDFSFVTGESDPVPMAVGDYIYAGGRQVGGAIELETVKKVSQSYLTSLWNHEVFQKPRGAGLRRLSDQMGRRFTLLVLGVSLASALVWLALGQPATALRAFIAVLIVACPCALALAAPFTLGSAMRFLGRAGFFLRNDEVIERIAQADTLVFDKTGTLTDAAAAAVQFDGDALRTEEWAAISALARQSTHPHCRLLARQGGAEAPPVSEFREVAGQGVEGRVGGLSVRLGSAAWVGAPEMPMPAGAAVYASVGGAYRGVFLLGHAYRPEIGKTLRQLSARFRTAVLSGDNDRERDRLRAWFGPDADLRFNQTPLAKLEYIRTLQQEGRVVLMVGDGLNDAGALRQSDVGIAVAEDVTAFSPASDAIMDAALITRLGGVVDYCRAARRIVFLGFGLSFAYNLVGVSFAASGLLSPVVCAILMPISSVTVVGFAVWSARRHARRTQVLA